VTSVLGKIQLGAFLLGQVTGGVITPPEPGAETIFRRTLSEAGTRTGARQMVS